MKPLPKSCPQWIKDYVADLEQEVRKLKADMEDVKVPERLPLPTWEEGIINGWDFNLHILKSDYSGSASNAVSKCCTSSTGHGRVNWGKTTSQRPRRVFATKKDATIALRAAFVDWVKPTLAKLDREIEECDE